jgi:hypothetical protein
MANDLATQWYSHRNAKFARPDVRKTRYEICLADVVSGFVRRLEDTMIQIKLKPEIEARLVADANAEGIEPAVYAGSMIERVYIRVNSTSRPSRKPEEVRAWLDFLTQFSDKIPQLPDQAFTRESFYHDHE